eukprot:3656513-Pleurochrysis_carterae.AAC.1
MQRESRPRGRAHACSSSGRTHARAASARVRGWHASCERARNLAPLALKRSQTHRRTVETSSMSARRAAQSETQ